AVRSNRTPGTTSAPVQASMPVQPGGPYDTEVKVPPPEAPAYRPKPPVIVKGSLDLSVPPRTRQPVPLVLMSISPLPGAVRRAVVGGSRTESAPGGAVHPAGAFSRTYVYDSSTVPRPGTTTLPLRTKHSKRRDVPDGQ